MTEAIPPLSQYAFMAWRSVKKKHRDNFTFTFTFLHNIIYALQLFPLSGFPTKLLYASLLSHACYTSRKRKNSVFNNKA